MSNSIDNMFNRLTDILKANTPESIEKLLEGFGVTKEQMINTINNIDQNELSKKMNSEEVNSILQSLSAEEIEKLKHTNVSNKDEIEHLYKSFIRLKEGK